MKEIFEAYQSGKSISAIGREFKKDWRTVVKILGDTYVPKYNNEQRLKQSRDSTKLFDESVFDTLDEETSYWIGFLMADGCLYNGNQVNLLLGKRDRDHLLKYQRFLKSTHKINDNTNKKGISTCQLRFRSKKVYDRLVALGFTLRKTGSEKAPEELKYSPYFWRGVIDGDGCISRSGVDQDRVTLANSERLCNEFYQFAIKVTGANPNLNPVIPLEGVYQCALYGDNCRKVLAALYASSNIHLDRKRERALAILDRLTPRQKLVNRARSLGGMHFIREQNLPPFFGDCSSFMMEVFKSIGLEFSDSGRMGCGGMGASTMVDRMKALGLKYVDLPQPGTVVVWNWLGTPHHLGLITETLPLYSNVIHLSHQIGEVSEHPLTGQWMDRLHGFMEPPILWHTNEKQEPAPQKEHDQTSEIKNDQSTQRLVLPPLAKLDTKLKLPSLGGG